MGRYRGRTWTDDQREPAQLRDHDGADERRVRGHPSGLAGGGRRAGDRACLALRSPHADRRRPGRPGVRGLDAAVRARGADRAAARRPARDQQPVPAARDACQDRGDRRRRVRRPARVRHRRGLAARPPDRPPRVRGARPALPRRRARGRQPRRSVHGDTSPVDRGCAVRLRRRVRAPDGRLLQSQAGSATAPADRHRRRFDTHAASGRRACGRVELPGRRHGRRRTARRAARRLLRGHRPRPRRDRPLDERGRVLRTARRNPLGAIGAALDAGFRHFVLSLPAPYPEGVARWVADEIVTPSAGNAGP